jgi:hypothetical protein
VLTLADSRRLADCAVFRDVTWGQGERSLTATFYVLGDAPRLSVAADGGPGYQFFWYRGASPAQSGGLLVVSVTATPDRPSLADDIRALYGLAADAPVQIAPAPVSSGTVSLSFAGESGGQAGELAAAVLGGGPARQTGSDSTTFAVALTADGAALLAQTLGSAEATLEAGYDLALPYVLDDVALHVWCDTQAACRFAADLAAAGPVTPGGLVDGLLAHQLAGATCTSARPLSADETAALDDLRQQTLGTLVPGTLLDASGSPRPYDASLEQRLNLTLTATYPAVRTATLTAALALPAAPTHVSVLDASADALLRRVEVSVSGDMAARGIASVGVRLDYAGTSATGAAVSRSAQAVLRPGAQTAVLSFDLATADQRTLQPHVDVYFLDGSSPYGLDLAPCDDDVLELDLDQLGVLCVDLVLGAVDPALAARAYVELECGALTGSYWLDGTTPSARWIAVVRDVVGPYRWRAGWSAGAASVPGVWQDDTRRRLVLDAPPDLVPPNPQVAFLSAGPFDAVASILAEVRAGDGDPVTTLTFTAPDQQQAWAAPPGPLHYQVRTTVVPAAAAPVIGEWVDSDALLQVVTDTLRLVVTVVGELLFTGPDQARRAVVQFQSPDGSEASVVLAPGAAQATCTLRLTQPGQTGYRFRLIASPADGGPTRTGDWQTGSSSLLVVRLPSVEPVPSLQQ